MNYIRLRNSQNLSFPKIISGRIGDVTQPRREWRQWRQIVGRLDATAHLSVMSGACVLDCNTLHRRKEFAADALVDAMWSRPRRVQIRSWPSVECQRYCLDTIAGRRRLIRARPPILPPASPSTLLQSKNIFAAVETDNRQKVGNGGEPAHLPLLSYWNFWRSLGETAGNFRNADKSERSRITCALSDTTSVYHLQFKDRGSRRFSLSEQCPLLGDKADIAGIHRNVC